MANPSSSTTPTLGLELLYEGVKVDNDIFNNNFIKIDNALKGVMMFEKLVGTATITTAAAVTLPTTNWDFAVLKVGKFVGGGNVSGGGGLTSANFSQSIYKVLPGETVTINLPSYTIKEGTSTYMNVSNTNLAITFTSNTSVKAASAPSTAIHIELYKYATS